MDKVKKSVSGLKKQQSVLSHSMEVSDATVIDKEIAVTSKPFSDREFVKNCLLKATENVCLERRQSLTDISMTWNVISSCISDLAASIDGQLKEKVASFVAFSVAIDKSSDITDIAQLATFICGVNAWLAVTEEFVQLVPMTGMTKADIFVHLLVHSAMLE